MTDPVSPVSIVRQSELLSVCRATLYYKPRPVDADEAQLRRLIDQIYTRRPFLGSRGVKKELRRMGVWPPDQASRTISVSGDRIEFSASTACGGTGPYRWSLTGISLTLTEISPDACPGRSEVLAGYTYAKQ